MLSESEKNECVVPKYENQIWSLMSLPFSAFKEGLWCLGFDLGKYCNNVSSYSLCWDKQHFTKCMNSVSPAYIDCIALSTYFSSLGGARRHGGQFSNLREDKENIPHEVTLWKRQRKGKIEETQEKYAFWEMGTCTFAKRLSWIY